MSEASARTQRRPCPSCGRENDADQSFCGSCGSALALTCQVCGASSPPGFRYCGSCGAELEPEAKGQPSGEERRIVSVLFVDLVGFTSRSEDLDPEDVRDMLTRYYASLREQIESFGGVVEKFIGDAVMGVFGAPVAHGDDPERAVRAALQILDAVEALNAADPGPDLAVRIGVNTGEAIVSIDTREGEGLIAGDMVNTAARLQTAAATNSILVGEETYRCTSSTLDFEPVEPLTVKGKEAPVHAWRVLGAPLPPGERAAPDVPMVGREQELAALMGVWDRVVAERHPHLVTVFGLPGVGKSRLAAEFVATVRDAGAQVLLGRSLPYGESGAYGAFAQQVKRVAGVLDSDPTDAAAEKLRSSVEGLLGAEDADELTAHVAMMLGLPSSGAAAGDDVSDRHVLFYSARRLVEALGNEMPTVLVFQDLHWADSSLLDLIEQLGTRVEDTPVMLLALARPELQGKRPGWGGRVQASVALPLDPLDAERSRELATRLLAHTSAAVVDAPVEEICDVGEGNPLFIEELVASVAERSAPSGVELPSSVRGIIAARLDAIPPPERSLLLDASVVGRIFWNGALAQVAPNEERLPELLDSLEGRDLVRREPVSRFGGQQQFRFKHSLIREVAYAALPRPKRREAHAAVAGFLEQVHAEHDSPAALAHHWLEAGDRERAADYFVAAAEQASRGWAKEEAVGHYRKALELVGKEDKERYRELRLKLVVAQQTLWHKLDAEQIAERQGRGAAS